MASAAAEIGVIGGSGFYEWLSGAYPVAVETPYGAPSASITIGSIAGRGVAFLPRHGFHHERPPHLVNYRANMWALREVGVRRVIGPCAAGSLRPDLRPGDFVVLDQLVDRTWGRPDTYVEGAPVNHVGFADPYCPELRSVLRTAAENSAEESSAARVHDGATVVVVQGPRFSTRAESRWFRTAGWDVVNMTQYPEAYLARELGMCYAGLALVTDYDTGLEEDEGIEPVSMEAVLEVLRSNVERTRELLGAAIPTIPEERSCRCAEGATGAIVV
jgi:5'-methylthioadenosine phosphorylase